jgi:thiol:disulfide interchange protein
LLLVHLSAAWSAGSRVMEREVWSDPRIAFHRGPIVALLIDLTNEGTEAELWAQRYGVRAVPTTIIFDEAGRELSRLSGPASADDVVAALDVSLAERGASP